jgi:ParB family transcriptional regulator, chromosome partitioning protein
MNQPKYLEWHQLDYRYAHIRIHTETAIRRMILSIQSYGLLTPIKVVPLPSTDQTTRWVVIDGYLRIAVAKRLKHDGLEALIYSNDAKEALVALYRQSASRVWEPYEEAQLIQTLLSEHKLCQTEIAQQLGKSKSWVTYRLQLLQGLPDFVEQAIREGALSTWATQRVILPFARANAHDARKLVDYLRTNNQTSRDIQAYFIHYLRNNKQVRKNMTDDPQHFFRARYFQMKSETILPDKLPPEEAWESILMLCLTKLKTLESLLPGVFYLNQPSNERALYKKTFETLTKQVLHLQYLIEGACHV